MSLNLSIGALVRDVRSMSLVSDQLTPNRSCILGRDAGQNCCGPVFIPFDCLISAPRGRVDGTQAHE